MIRSGIRVEGLEDALRTVNAQIKLIPFRTLKGMIAAGLTIQRRAQNLVPVDLGNLKASAFTTWATKASSSSPSFRQGEKGRKVDTAKLAADHASVVAQSKASLSPRTFVHPQVEVGFSANYAIYVHEDMEAAHKKGKQAKFLQEAFVQGRSDIIKAIETETIMKRSD